MSILSTSIIGYRNSIMDQIAIRSVTSRTIASRDREMINGSLWRVIGEGTGGSPISE